MEATRCAQVQDDASRKWLSTIAFFFRKAVVSLRVPSAFILAGAALLFFRKCNGPENVSYDKPSEEIAPARANVVVAEHGVNVLIMFHE
jgi:hypothetical protein